ncbi:MAG: sensor histidine kinase [Spirochaetales bacterium]|nr:sensor histidine kinase [Spirochaetales bacterium]
MSESGTTGRGDRNAFSVLLADVVERLLAFADNPRSARKYIAEEMRGLVGARTVVVVSHTSAHGKAEHAVRSVYPERRRDMTQGKAFEDLVEASHQFQSPRVFRADEDGQLAGLLRELSVKTAVLLPLLYGTQRAGVIVLLDLLDDESLPKALDALEQLSSVLALVLRNADLYGNLEARVAERTNLLEQRQRELEALLKEVHHRVKNNLQIVLSLLNLTASTSQSAEARALLETSQARIFAMSLVHEEIYRTGDFSGIDLANYAPRIADQLLMTTFPAVRREYHVSSLRLGLEIAIPCGLILSELITNSIKHAFSVRGTGTLLIETGMIEDEAFIRVADDGPGFSACPQNRERPGIGLDIIDSLVHQINGRIVREAKPGASCLLVFKP